MLEFNMRQGTNIPSLRAQAIDALNRPVDLTGASLTFIMESIETGALAVNRAAVPDADQVNNKGWWDYFWQVSDTNVPVGDYTAYMEATWSGPQVGSFPVKKNALIVHITEKFA